MNSEATDAIMATLGEYDSLWDGTLSPEIVDAEMYDCSWSGGDWSPLLPAPLCLHNDPDLLQTFDRDDALCVLIEVIMWYVGDSSPDTPLFPEGVDAELYDCPLDIGVWYDCYILSQDWPSVDSLK